MLGLPLDLGLGMCLGLSQGEGERLGCVARVKVSCRFRVLYRARIELYSELGFGVNVFVSLGFRFTIMVSGG